jgi:hypothetical protein
MLQQRSDVHTTMHNLLIHINIHHTSTMHGGICRPLRAPPTPAHVATLLLPAAAGARCRLPRRHLDYTPLCSTAHRAQYLLECCMQSVPTSSKAQTHVLEPFGGIIHPLDTPHPDCSHQVLGGDASVDNLRGSIAVPASIQQQCHWSLGC